MRLLLSLATAGAVAVTAQLLAASPAPNTFPPGGAWEQALGDVQLRQAYEAATAQAIADGVWHSLYGGEPLFSLPDSCVGVSTAVATPVTPFPQYPRGVLAATLARGSLRACTVAATQQYSPTGATLLDTTSGLPTGVYVAYTNAIVSRLGLAYNRRYLTTTWVVLASADACFDALAAGYADVLPAHYGAYPYNGIARYYQAKASSCLTRSSTLTAWLVPTGPYANVMTFADLAAAMSTASPPRVCAQACAIVASRCGANVRPPHAPDAPHRRPPAARRRWLSRGEGRGRLQRGAHGDSGRHGDGAGVPHQRHHRRDHARWRAW